MMVAALALVAARIIAAAVLPPLCTKALPPEKCQRIGAGDYRQFPAANHSICAAACCADARCGSWNWDASMSVPATMPACRSGGKSLPCCYLKGGGLENCTGNSTANDPAAWSGVARPGKPVQPRPAPAPPAPPAHRGHSSAGTPDGMSASYDCEVRKHAWEFGKATLPRHGSFKTLFDALQLRQCEGVTAPPTVDAFVPPYFSTPTHGHVIYADSTAPAGGDGTLARPFATLEAGLAAAAASASSNATLLLRRGRYHTSGVVLTSAHSGLTIQNYEGEAAIVSGSVAVPGSAKNWSPHKKQTNTWKLDLSSIDGMPTQAFGMRVGSRRATLARWPNGDVEVGGEADPRNGLSAESLAAFSRVHDPENETKVIYSSPDDWPGVFWLEEAEGGNLPVAGANVAGTGHWYNSYGGRCSGRQAPYGFWCSGLNPRSQLPSDPQVPYSMPGGFKLNPAMPDQARAANWSQPRGAIYHIRANFFSIQCLVDSIDHDGTVHFNHSVGCDQGGPSPWGGSPGACCVLRCLRVCRQSR